MINDVILGVLFSWLLPLTLFVFYFVTDPVRGTRWRRRLIDVRQLTTVSKFVLAQKIGLIAIVLFIGFVRFFGRFPGFDWVALSLYLGLVSLAWGLLVTLRRLQVDRERRIRAGADPDSIDDPTTSNKEGDHD